MKSLTIGKVKNLAAEEQAKLDDLVAIYNRHIAANRIKNKYYEGHISLADVNLGIAMPKAISKLEIGCEWGAKAVDVLASRSMFDGFVGRNGYNSDELGQIVADNRLISGYNKARIDELKYGCCFSTLSSDPEIGCKIRWHSPETAAARWSGQKGRIDYGFAIIDTAYDNDLKSYNPSLVNMYTDDAVIVISKKGNVWSADYFSNPMGRPLMEPLIWNATNKKPFGRSRIKAAVRHLIEGYVRTVANASIGLEFSTAPQKYLLGVSDDQYDALTDQKFMQYIGSILLATKDSEGGIPNFGQLPQGNIEPHIQMMRLLATQFSAATGLSVTDTGIVNDANPTSSDAILAQSQTLVTLAETMNQANADCLNTIAQMALAIKRNCTLDELSEEDRSMMAHFRNPAMPSVASTADAAIKIASSRPEFSNTDVFLEMIGFSQADIARVRAQEQLARGQKVLMEFDDEYQSENMDEVQG